MTAVLRGIRKERRRCCAELREIGQHEVAHYLSLGPQPILELDTKDA